MTLFPCLVKGEHAEDAGAYFGVFYGKQLIAKKETPTNFHENHCRGRGSSRDLGLSQLRGNWLVCTCTQDRFPALLSSRIPQPVDDQQCWSIACLFIKKPLRKKGVSTELILVAVVYAKSQGAELLEGYPVEPKVEQQIPAAFAWTGISKAFISAGFREIVRRSPTRPVMRLELN